MRSVLPLLAAIMSLVPVGSVRCQSENTQKPVPRFEDFPVDASFHGKPAKPVLDRNDAFRTKILEGALNGPNFAGHYTIIDWGCGSGCISFAIVDAVSGRLYSPIPFSALGVPYQGAATGREYKGLDYRVNSALLIADGCPEEKVTMTSETENDCGTRYYKWEQNRFVLVASIMVPAARK